jgi:hypothetical protein
MYTELLYSFPPENHKIYNANVLLKYFFIVNIGLLYTSNLKQLIIYSFYMVRQKNLTVLSPVILAIV